MKLFDVDQGSEEWFTLRKGVPTASRFSKILTPKTMKASSSQDELICELIGEKLSLIPPEGVENFTNRAVRWGQQCEDEARKWYSVEANKDVHRVGFCMTDDERFGSSPDGLVGDDGVLELKCPQANTQVRYLLGTVLPDDYKCQVHGHLIVTGRKYCDFLSYSPGLPALLVRTEPNEFTKELRVHLEIFWGRFQAALKKIQEA